MSSVFPFKLVDLSHALDSKCPTWEGDCGFLIKNTLDYADYQSNPKFRVQALNLHAGIGTHVDAPAHCISGGKTIEKLQLHDLLAPCVVINVADRADVQFILSVQDILWHEEKYGRITSNQVVLVHTGWSRYWEKPEQYRNQLQFPSISLEVAQLLLEKNIKGLGIDTLSPDIPKNGYPVHQLLLGAGLYLLENVANANLLPPTDSFILALPLKIKKGSEAPIRLVGFIPYTQESLNV